MNPGKKIPFFLVLCLCLVSAPVFLPAPAFAQNSGKVAISGTIPLVIYDISVTNISSRGATVSWKTNGVTYGSIEYGTTTGYGFMETNWTLAKEHSITLTGLMPGRVYHFRLNSADISGDRAVSRDLTFSTPYSGPSPVGGGGGDTFIGPWSVQQPVLPVQLPGPPGPLCQDEASRNYTAGFAGMLYNADGNRSLDLDISQALASGTDVIIEPDHIDVYPQKTGDMILRFWLETSDIRNATRIVKYAESAELRAGPLAARFTSGSFSGSFHAMPTRILPLSRVNITLSACIPEEIIAKIWKVSAQNNLEPENILYTMNVVGINLPETGAADVTMTLPASQVDTQEGTDAIHIARIGDESGTPELLDTVFAGRDTSGAMIFRAESQGGNALFVIFSARPMNQNPQDKTPFGNNSPVVQAGRLPATLFTGAILILVLTVLAVVVIFFGWRRKKGS